MTAKKPTVKTEPLETFNVGSKPTAQQEIPFGADAFMTKPKDPWKSNKPRCYESHPDFEIAPGLIIRGGSCINPMHQGQDVYIGFDGSMRKTEQAYPWSEGDEILMKITDQHDPDSPKLFRKLVEWTAEQLKAGRTVHAGCIGGHGRTGMFFAALRKYLVPEDPDPIGFVRKNYCEKAVETRRQIDFLMKEYGAADAKPTKQGYTGTHGSSSYSKPSKAKVHSFSGGASMPRSTGKPMNAQSSIWGG